jgi:hypothetical protein
MLKVMRYCSHLGIFLSIIFGGAAQADGWIGVEVKTVTDGVAADQGMDRARGALVNKVVENGPAERAGIIPGDIIINFDGHNIRDVPDLPEIVLATPVGNSAEVILMRGSRVKIIFLTVGQKVGGQNEVAKQDVEEPASPSQDETLSAIRDIYRNIGSCRTRYFSSVNPGVAVTSTHYVNSFSFGWNKSSVRFMWNEKHVSYHSYPSDNETTENSDEFVSFNPADLDHYEIKDNNDEQKNSSVTSQVHDISLAAVCKRNEECVSSSAYQRKQSVGYIQFCGNLSDRTRIVRALQHLHQFYQPSKRLPF